MAPKFVEVYITYFSQLVHMTILR